MRAKRINGPLIDRFWAKVDKREPDECWEWQAGVNADGYGMIYSNGPARAHRVAYELLVGPIPEGLHIDHLCRNRGCVNPAHLEPVTCRVNVLRGGGLAAGNARKDVCQRGHQFSPENTYVQPSNGKRFCRTCKRAHAAEFRARSASKPPAGQG